MQCFDMARQQVRTGSLAAYRSAAQSASPESDLEIVLFDALARGIREQ
jgi:hypothetical protein